MSMQTGADSLQSEANLLGLTATQVFNVTTSADIIDSSDGLLSLREAVIAANAVSLSEDVVINLSQGHYGITRNSSFQFGALDYESDLFINQEYGDFDILRSMTINGNGATISADFKDRIFQIFGTSNVEVIMNDFDILTGGSVSNGAGLHVSGGADVLLNNVDFRNNKTNFSSQSQGGGLYADNAGGKITINAGSFTNNIAGANQGGEARGGAIHLANGELEVDGTVFEFNFAEAIDSETSGVDGASVKGGAIYIDKGDVSLNNATFERNRADAGQSAENDNNGIGGYGFGGAVYVNNASSFVINNSNFTSNRVFAAAGGKRGGDASGGAIFLRGRTSPSDLTIEDSIFQDNWALGGRAFDDFGGDGGRAFGGAIASIVDPFTPATTIQDITIRNTLFEENRARGGLGGFPDEGRGGTGGNASGGAVWTYGFIDTRLTFEDSVMLNNLAVGGNGGGIRIGQAGNGGDGYGGAIATNARQFTLRGSLSVEGELGEEDAQINSSSFLQGNLAAGGIGGRKGNSTSGSSQDDAGDGGNGYGGAIATSSANTTIQEILIDSNFAYGGNGGSGTARREVNPLYVGTKGGDNGDGHGGGLYVGQEESSTRIPNASLTIIDSSLTNNVASGSRIDIDPNDFRIRSAPQAGGTGGANKNGIGLSGGLGGDAYGGALDFVSNGNLSITGSGFVSNQANGSLGGSGGAGWNDGAEKHGGDGGKGGDAVGGAINVVTQGAVELNNSVLYFNRATAGRGGSGGLGGSTQEPNLQAGHGGNGGAGGLAQGGALSIQKSPSGTSLTPVLVEDTYLLGNAVLGGDGGFGGNGGNSPGYEENTEAGDGGNGGNGGSASGGGIFLLGTNGVVKRSTIEQNITSSGFGTQGGYGGASNLIGGDGGDGGNAGDAQGGGIFVDNSLMELTHNTVVKNLVASGFGGYGGFGGSQQANGYADEIGGGNGSGGDGGDGGDARGGGVYVGSSISDVPTNNGFLSTVTVEASTIARNNLDAGGSGFGGIAGRFRRDEELFANKNRYTSLTSYGIPRFYEGSNRVFFDGSSSLLSFNPLLTEDDTEASSETAGDQIGDSEEVALGIIGPSLLALGGAGAIAGGVGVGGAISAGFIGATGSVLISATATTTTAGAGVLAGGIAATGVIAGPLLFLTVGGVIAAKVITYGITTGDWEGAFEYGLGTPGDVYKYNFSFLLTGGGSNDDDDDDVIVIPINGTNGTEGQIGKAEGTGIYGLSGLSRTIVSDNHASLRQRIRLGHGDSFTLEGSPFPITISDGQSDTYYVDQKVTSVARDDVVGGYSLDGKNFIGAVDSGFTNDLHGTTANPLSANLDDRTQLNGGTVPTMKLLPLSPARQAITLSENDTSQNDYVWLSSELADIGAWGGPANRPPNQGEVIILTVAEDNSLTIEESTLLAREFDPDLDPLSLVSYQVVPGQTNGTVSQEGSSLIYTPAPDFFGSTVFAYSVTDGEFTSTISVIVNVTPVNDAPIAFDGTATTAEDTWVDIDMRNFVTDIDTPINLLDFLLVEEGDIYYPEPVNGSVELLADGYTARFTPDADFNGDGSFRYLVYDPGNGYGPPRTVGLKTITVSVTPVNDAPVNVLPDAQTVDEDELLEILGLNITDVDAAEGDNQMQVTLEVEHGTLSLASVAGLTFEGDADGTDDLTMTFTGDLAAIQSALSAVDYKPFENFNGADQLKITSNDLGNFGEGGALSDTDTLDITVNPVNDAPVLTIPDAQMGYEDVRLTFNDISIADVDVAEGDGLIEVTLEVEHGTLTLSQTTGLTFTDGDGIRNTTMTFTGTLEDVNAALLGMYYLGALDYSGSDTLSISTNDQGNFGKGGVLTDAQNIGITLLSSEEQSDILRTQVNELYDDGILNKGRFNALTTQLTLKGKNIDGDAGNILGFIGNVQDLIDTGILTEELGEPLIAAAEFLYKSVKNSDR